MEVMNHLAVETVSHSLWSDGFSFPTVPSKGLTVEQHRASSVYALTIIFEPTSSDGGKLGGPSERLAIRVETRPSWCLSSVLYLHALMPCLRTRFPTFLAS